MCFKSSVFQIFRNNFYNVKHCSTKSLYYNPTYKRQNLTHFDFKPKFKDEDQGKILNILNNSTKDELRRLNVSQSGIQILEAYRSKNGPFQSLQDLLGVDGLSLNMLEKLCGQIIVDTPGKFTHKIINKRSKNFLTPNLPTEKIPNVLSIVGIHLTSTGVSWAKLSVSKNELQNWCFHDFGSLPKKMFPTDTFNLATAITNAVPYGDLYVFERVPGMFLQGQNQSSALTMYTQQLEITSMLLALLNTSTKHNPRNGEAASEDLQVDNKVHFLNPKLPARLFKTLVGNEKVSAGMTVSQLISECSNTQFSQSYSPIHLSEVLRTHYRSQSASHKELLGQALMLSIAFIDICIRKTPISINTVIGKS